ncbi:MAG: hypothetical protein HY481_01205 [Candidatus Vogelbacteria bacterium]|nr:hypothetical protein [Candidatus Vogelbacteria bacterium]
MPGRRDLLRPPRRLRGVRRLIFLWLFLVVAGAFWLCIFLNDERFALRTIEISGNRLLADEVIVLAAREALAGRRLWIFRRDRYWFYDPRAVAAVLRQRFDRLASVKVAAPRWQTLRLEVVERQTAALWCPVELEVPAACFYLDATGLVFARAPHFSWPPLLVITGSWPSLRLEAVASTTSVVAARPNDRSVGRAGIGNQPLPRSLFSRLIKLRSLLGSFFAGSVLAGASVKQITVTPVGDLEFKLVDERSLARPFKIIIGRGQSDEEILTLLRVTLDAPSFESELATGRTLEYFDLRFADKVFYRWRE